MCSVCSALSNARENLNHRCGHTFSGRRYYGIYKSAMTYLWDPCAGCEATGRVGSEVCRECAGFGWKLYA